MPKKEESPLQKVSKENNQLKKKVDAINSECDKALKDKKPESKEKRLTELVTRYREAFHEVETLFVEAENLQEEKEPSKVKNFDTKRKDEIKKIQTLQERLKKVAEKGDFADPTETQARAEEDEDVDDEAETDDEVEEEEVDEDDDDEDEYESDEDDTDEDDAQVAAYSKKNGNPNLKPSPRHDKREEIKAALSAARKGHDSPGHGKHIDRKAVLRRRDEEESEEDDSDEEDTQPPHRRKDGRSNLKPSPRHDKHDDRKAASAAHRRKQESESESGEYEESVEEEEELEEEEVEEEEESLEEDDNDDEDDVSEDEEQEYVDHGKAATMRQYIAFEDFEAQEVDDLSFRKGDVLTIIAARTDGWLEAENDEGKRGLVPSTYLKVFNKYKDAQESDEDSEDEAGSPDPKSPRSGKFLWKNIKKAVKETSVTDVLHAMGAVPAGFRDSTLAKKAATDQFSPRKYLAPKLSPSCVSFKDLFINTETNRIRTRNVRTQRIVTITAARQIPPPGAGVEILSRHVRVCLFDGENILSNIHTIKISTIDKDQRTWNFNTKVSDQMKSAEFGEFFIRCNSSEGNLGILFELCVSYIRTSTDQEGEFSCGWVHLPLFQQDGVPAQNKSYDLFVNGGTIYEKGVDVDPSVGRRASSSMFRSLVAGNKQPRLVVRLAAPTKDQKDLLDTLPDVLVSSTSYIQYISFYRQYLADALINDTMDSQSTELIHSPLLASFPDVIEQSDLMDVLRSGWADRLRRATRAEKRDQVSIQELFSKVYLDYVYPLLHSASLPPYRLTDKNIEEARYTEIQRLLKIGRDKKMMAAALLSSETMHKPFDISELSFNVIGPYCVSR